MNSKIALSKNKMKITLLFLLFIITVIPINKIKATHFMGGEITWTCDNGNGKYHFTLRLYRDCFGIEYQNTEVIDVINNKSISKIPMKLVSKTDNSPVCNILGPHITCANPGSPNGGAIEEWVYTSDVGVYTSGVPLSGVPPPQGWVFAYKSPGFNKRNESNNIISAELKTWALRAVMYPYKDHNANPCYDNSPTFAEKPSSVICTGYNFTYNPNAYDNELDSLVYDWASPKDSSLQSIKSYVINFDSAHPLPGPNLDARNVSATINHQTGEISFTSFTIGAYLTVSKVTAYKNNVKVAEIFREMQIVLLACNANNPPTLTPPFKGNTSFIDTVYAGQVVDFHLKTTDDAGQILTLSATGPDFGTNYLSTTTGCLTPPCATMNPPPVLTGSSPVETQFHWETSCDHLTHPVSVGSKNNLIYNKPTLSNVHNFVFSIQDDFCAVPGKNVKTISIVVLNKPILPAPSLRCLAVDNVSGNVTLSWVNPVDTSNSFYRYYIYSSLNKNGPFTVLDSILIPTTASYTDTKVNAKNQVVYYYLTSLSGCNHIYPSAPGDTLSTLQLSLVNANNGLADLSWNYLHKPPLATSAADYDIYREYPKGTWVLIDGTSKTHYVDTITVCSAFINYRIELPDQSGCKSVSNIAGDLFKDITYPETPLIDTVSIDTLQKKTILGWTATPDKDAIGYIIYEFINNVWTPIDTVKGRTITNYLNNKSTPYSGYESYYIAAFDSCRNLSPTSPPHNTLYLSAALDICNSSITLSWNPYKFMKNIEGYKIFYSENNSPFTLLATTDTLTTKFVHNNLLPGTNYCYIVKAFDSSGTVSSTSNKRCIFSIVSQKAKFAYIRYATVVQEKTGDEHIDIRFIADSASFISKYVILRSDSAAGIFLPLKTLLANGQYDITHSDFSTFPSKQSYSYKIEAYDSCGNVAVTSNVGRSIFLTGTANNDLTNGLNWYSPYFEWEGAISGYNIYRDIGNNNNFVFLTTVTPLAPYTYIDDISSMTLAEGYYSYIVEAMEDKGPIYNFADMSRSNKAIILQQPKYFIPNAFNPESGNHIFTPVGIFNNISEYYFAVFNRWGMKVFETNEPNEGWDGTYNGNKAPFATYAYILRYKDALGKRLIKKGSVTLIR